MQDRVSKVKNQLQLLATLQHTDIQIERKEKEIQRVKSKESEIHTSDDEYAPPSAAMQAKRYMRPLAPRGESLEVKVEARKQAKQLVADVSPSLL